MMNEKYEKKTVVAHSNANLQSIKYWQNNSIFYSLCEKHKNESYIGILGQKILIYNIFFFSPPLLINTGYKPHDLMSNLGFRNIRFSREVNELREKHVQTNWHHRSSSAPKKTSDSQSSCYR